MIPKQIKYKEVIAISSHLAQNLGSHMVVDIIRMVSHTAALFRPQIQTWNAISLSLLLSQSSLAVTAGGAWLLMYTSVHHGLSLEYCLTINFENPC